MNLLSCTMYFIINVNKFRTVEKNIKKYKNYKRNYIGTGFLSVVYFLQFILIGILFSISINCLFERKRCSANKNKICVLASTKIKIKRVNRISKFIVFRYFLLYGLHMGKHSKSISCCAFN